MTRHLTPPTLAKAWGIKPEKIIGFIRRGELDAVNIASNPRGRPRWIISHDAIARFEARRSAVAQVTAPTPRRRKRQSDVPEFYRADGSRTSRAELFAKRNPPRPA